MLIQIDGWFAGGKGVLWSLLDGHSEIFVNPIHDFSYAPLLEQSNQAEWIQKKHTTHLRKLLSPSEYYKFEKVYLEKKLEIFFSADVAKVLDYSVDFYSFDRAFFQKLACLKEWNLEKVVKLLYETYYEEYTQQSISYPKYYATMSHPGKYKSYKNIPKLFPNMKSVTVKRGIKNIIATRTNRRERPNDLNTYQAFTTPFEVILQRREIENILQYYAVNESLQEQYPKQFMVLSFEELVENSASTMKKVAKFLEINYEDIMALPTRDGKLLEHQGMSFIGKENDDYRQLLSHEEITIIDEKIKQFHQNANVFTSDETLGLQFSKQINQVYTQLNELKNQYKKIALYGYGRFSELIVDFLGENLCAVFDQLADTKESGKVQLYSLESLHEKEYEVLLVTVLGRENAIIKDLIEIYKVPQNKIVCLNLWNPNE